MNRITRPNHESDDSELEQRAAFLFFKEKNQQQHPTSMKVIPLHVAAETAPIFL
jgi:hypothetical protein